MSFIFDKEQGETYRPGWFLAVDEPVIRKTKQIAQSGAVTTDEGAKYVPMGVAWPSNDANAVGIVYEDVDVTSGNMPGSIVMSGTVYEDRLAIVSYSYNAVTLKNLVSPKANGWQERSGSSPNYTYANSTDTTVNTSKTYYLPDDDHTAVTNYAAELNPVEEGWYESDGGSGYELSDDTVASTSTTYYTKDPNRLSDNAKSALQSLGFTFISSEPTVTRPY